MTKTDLIHAWFENLWNRGIESTIDEMFAADVVVHGLGETDILGREEFRTFYRTFRSSFPTVHVRLTHVHESEDHVTSQAEVDVMAADGRGPFRLNGSTTVRVRGQQFVEGWNNFDFLSLLVSMGAVQPNALADAMSAAAALTA